MSEQCGNMIASFCTPSVFGIKRTNVTACSIQLIKSGFCTGFTCFPLPNAENGPRPATAWISSAPFGVLLLNVLDLAVATGNLPKAIRRVVQLRLITQTTLFLAHGIQCTIRIPTWRRTWRSAFLEHLGWRLHFGCSGIATVEAGLPESMAGLELVVPIRNSLAVDCSAVSLRSGRVLSNLSWCPNQPGVPSVIPSVGSSSGVPFLPDYGWAGVV